MQITERTIDTARHKGVSRFDDVLLVGGMTLMPAIAQTLKERFGLQARIQDPHLAVAKGAARFLMQKVKVTMLEEGDQAAEEVADRLGISVQQVVDMVEQQVATVVPRAFGIKVVDPDDPAFKTNPDLAREYISHLLTANTPLPLIPALSRSAPSTTTSARSSWRYGSKPARWLRRNSSTTTTSGKACSRTCLSGQRERRSRSSSTSSGDEGLLKVHGLEADSGREIRFEIPIGSLDEAEVRQAARAVARYEVSG